MWNANIDSTELNSFLTEDRPEPPRLTMSIDIHIHQHSRILWATHGARLAMDPLRIRI